MSNSIINRDEIKRLERALKEKDRTHLVEWAQQLESSISLEVDKMYDSVLTMELANLIDDFMLAMMFTLLTDRNVTIKKDSVGNVLDALYKNIDKFRTGSLKPNDFLGILKKNGVNLLEYNYQHRLTDIVAVVVDEKTEPQQQLDIVNYFIKQNLIVLPMDNTKDNEKQIRKNVDIINMCTRLYYYGDNETIQIYKQYAEQIRKPVLDCSFILFEPMKPEDIYNELKEN